MKFVTIPLNSTPMFGKILNATVSGLTAIPFAFAAYHVCKNFFREEKPAVEESEEHEQEHQEVKEEQEQGNAAQQEGAKNEV